MLGPEYLPNHPRSIIRYPPTLRSKPGVGGGQNSGPHSPSNPSPHSLPASPFLILPHDLLRTMQRHPQRLPSAQSRPTHGAGTKVATATPSCQDRDGSYIFDLANFFWCAKRITRRCAPRPCGGALRALNFACGEVVEPAFCLSGVRIGRVAPSGPRIVATTVLQIGAAKRIRTPDPRITNQKIQKLSCDSESIGYLRVKHILLQL
jgi:hypothetical protein